MRFSMASFYQMNTTKVLSVSLVGSTATNGNSTTITTPSLQVGDLIIIHSFVLNSSFSMPSGYTNISNQSRTSLRFGGNMQSVVYYKVSDTTGTSILTLGNATHICVVYRPSVGIREILIGGLTITNTNTTSTTQNINIDIKQPAVIEISCLTMDNVYSRSSSISMNEVVGGTSTARFIYLRHIGWSNNGIVTPIGSSVNPVDFTLSASRATLSSLIIQSFYIKLI